MTKKKVYIVSHSHWDREWYLPYEEHHMRLIELVDNVLDLIENDPEFNSFHLDGQTIILDDYLQVRPEKKEAVKKAVQAGKLKIGPFYILQDDFLISSESNVRNMLIGHLESQKWGAPVQLGYFPDTFGNMGQTPQMMQLANLPAAAFGRGVKPIGFDNQVLESDYSSQYSEMWWEGPDQTKIFGLLFANWYSNGNEIPSEKEAAIAFWKQKLADVERYASTNHLLMMNGVDHQPVQRDITKAIALANELFPEYEFIHSNFDDYLKAVQEELPEDLGTVTGELTSQETDGWYTLANTSSARVYLKQWNTKVQRQLENIAEPLAAMAYEVTGDYPHDQFDYAWKTLLQNHPHDSICGCSVDEVHRGMMTRFENANDVGHFLADEATRQLTEAIDTSVFPEKAHPFVLFNTSGYQKTEVVTVEVEIERLPFYTGKPEDLYHELKQKATPDYQVIDPTGKAVASRIVKEDVRFGYDLPKDAFRQPYMAKYLTVELSVKEMAPFSWDSFALIQGETKAFEGSLLAKPAINEMENEFIQVKIENNGSLTIADKKTGETFSKLLTFEDTGDIGNEYIFFKPTEDQGITTENVTAEITNKENSPVKASYQIKQTVMLPVAADERLEEEQKAVREFRERHAQRSTTLRPFEITTVVTMIKESNQLFFETTINNQIKDHRLRVLFPTGMVTETHEADSIYEVVTRPNQVSDTWENPTNPQHQQAFVNVHDQNKGVTIFNEGLNEYEVLADGTIAVTLIRCVGELGDWGYFATPEAQCQGEYTFKYGLSLHGKPEERFATYQQAYSAQIPFTAATTARHEGKLAPNHVYLTTAEGPIGWTAVKRQEQTNHLVVRGFNLTAQNIPCELHKETQPATCLTNVLEEPLTPAIEVDAPLRPFEIRTWRFEK
ncbi:TPA: alpha-mannosidase [Enterococcus faecalis]|uniref:alpha-mannosidase n=1 Tax=Enterococcus TaxID=1350 RepID=UPI00033073CD|nr:alpha-mannosidase [Enterococcus faecalis]EGO2586029.1 alpha-mannosidase [Enterococcus faecalis]EGO2791643.1 alpha-mannosidase [Enterococcus faecalis]EGO5249631.1 alpha-mannosidase [Enterococcus faecalis]EGO5851099.1 alpha-mannosidase [Enterococcus faecalis]EGO8241149.1 alpha-mannosidase [Enterococcus faecalis]